MIKKAVIPAAGFGTRFLPATKVVPKELFPIVDVPTLQLIIDEAVQSGINEIYVIISKHKKIIIDHFSKNEPLETFLRSKNQKEDLKKVSNIYENVKIKFIYQNEILGLGHAILQTKKLINNEAFAVLLGDDLFKGDKPALKELMDIYNKKASTIIGTMKVPKDKTNKYGICEIEKEISKNLYLLKGIIEKPEPEVAPSRIAASGRYILSPQIFTYLEKQTAGVGGEIQLTDAILALMNKESIYAYNLLAKRYDIGSKVGYLDALIDFSINNKETKDEVIELIKNKAKLLK